MTRLDFETKPFRPGISGWTVKDLDDPEIEALWFGGRYELVDGVLTEMPPAAYYAGGNATAELIRLVRNIAEENKLPIRGGVECDIVLSEDRVARADGILMAREHLDRSRVIAAEHGHHDPRRQRIYFPPNVVIESISPGHEAHDRKLKRRWYAEFGVPNYWIVDAIQRRLDCLRLRNGKYVEDCSGSGNDVVTPVAFSGLTLELGRLWA